ncbi:hypothetical protein NP233_g2605 [Leucocoprinus birnbaumii]|uniref:Uncharacterized protein n=1 Tax=Leucocoprinus birnbaumii TaxID=56174 RepID=A0AAD5W0F6_9AGAR|nr:hypothetical protein NP233_g2605 [Leucocoprinus birnbaumii]
MHTRVPATGAYVAVLHIPRTAVVGIAVPQEARRRAEYEARHAEALRRVESENRFQHLEASNPYFRHRLSKSATTSPTATPALRPALPLGLTPEEQRYFGLSSERDGHPVYDDKKNQRRLSGPWHQQQQPPPSSLRANIGQSRSSGHLVDQMRPAGASYGAHHYAAWSHPYHPQPPHAPLSPSGWHSRGLPVSYQFRFRNPCHKFWLAFSEAVPDSPLPTPLLGSLSTPLFFCHANHLCRRGLYALHIPVPRATQDTQHSLDESITGSFPRATSTAD